MILEYQLSDKMSGNKLDSNKSYSTTRDQRGKRRRLEERNPSHMLPISSHSVSFFLLQTAYLAVFLTATLLLIVSILELHVLYNLLLPLSGPEQVNKKSSVKERTCQDRRTNEVKISHISLLAQTEKLPNIGIMSSINNGSWRLCGIKT